MKNYLGIWMIVLGALMLVVSYFADLKDYNWYQVLAFLIIVAGLIVHIIKTKKA